MKKISLAVLLLASTILFPIPASAAPTGNYVEASGGYIAATLPLSAAPSSIWFDAWVKPESLNGTQNVFVSGDTNSGQTQYEFGLAGNSVSLKIKYGTGSQSIYTAGSLQQGVWSQIGFSVSENGTTMRVNGTNVVSTKGVQGLRMLGPSLGIARQAYGSFFGSGQFNGALDDVALYANGSPVLIWHLDGTRGQTQATDSSGQGNHGVLTGGDWAIHYHGDQPQQSPMIPDFQNRPSLRPLPQISLGPVQTIWPTPMPIRITPMPVPTYSIPQPGQPTPTDSVFPGFSRTNREFRVQL